MQIIFHHLPTINNWAYCSFTNSQVLMQFKFHLEWNLYFLKFHTFFPPSVPFYQLSMKLSFCVKMEEVKNVTANK